jgi:hypothetical protein
MLRRRKVDPTDCTLLELAYGRTGSMLKAARVLAFVTAWDVVRRDLGRAPTVDEYAAWWKESRSTAFGHQAEFREVFGVDTPDVILDLVEDQGGVQRARIDWGHLAAA